MDKYRKLNELLSAKAAPANGFNRLISAKVVSIEGESCAVTVGDLELSDVRLKATINGRKNKILLLPKVGSYVLLGSLTGDLNDLCVLKVDELAQLLYEQNGLKIIVDSEDGKLSVENQSISLKTVLQQLVDLLKQFKVFTPSGPSGTALPDTMAKITKFENVYKQLLK